MGGGSSREAGPGPRGAEEAWPGPPAPGGFPPLSTSACRAAGLSLCVGDSPADACSSRGLGCIRQMAPRGSSSTCSRGGRHTPVLAPSTSPGLPQLSCGLGFASLRTATAATPPCRSLPVNVGFWKFLPPSSSTEAGTPRAFPFTPRKPQVGWGSEGQRICLCVPLKEENLGPRYPVPTQLQRAIGGQGSS